MRLARLGTVDATRSVLLLAVSREEGGAAKNGVGARNGVGALGLEEEVGEGRRRVGRRVDIWR